VLPFQLVLRKTAERSSEKRMAAHWRLDQNRVCLCAGALRKRGSLLASAGRCDFQESVGVGLGASVELARGLVCLCDSGFSPERNSITLPITPNANRSTAKVISEKSTISIGPNPTTQRFSSRETYHSRTSAVPHHSSSGNQNDSSATLSAGQGVIFRGQIGSVIVRL
jgi:hypothetical protein